MPLQVSTGVFNQAKWPGRGTGPLDDCWVLADFMGIHAVAPELALPTISRYRQAANIDGWKPVYPDTDVSEGGALEHSLKAIQVLWPTKMAATELYRGSWDRFIAKVKAGHPASCSVLSGSLPLALQFGFKLNHRVLVYWSGTTLRLLNPLAPPHSKPVAITLAALARAMADYAQAEPAGAIILPTFAQAQAAAND